MGPAEVVKFDAARFILEDKGAFREGLRGRFGCVELQIGDVFALPGGFLPAGRLVSLHLFSDTGIGQGRRTGLSPNRVAISVVAVMMGVEDVLYRFLRKLLDVFQS